MDFLFIFRRQMRPVSRVGRQLESKADSRWARLQQRDGHLHGPFLSPEGPLCSRSRFLPRHPRQARCDRFLHVSQLARRRCGNARLAGTTDFFMSHSWLQLQHRKGLSHRPSLSPERPLCSRSRFLPRHPRQARRDGFLHVSQLGTTTVRNERLLR